MVNPWGTIEGSKAEVSQPNSRRVDCDRRTLILTFSVFYPENFQSLGAFFGGNGTNNYVTVPGKTDYFVVISDFEILVSR